MGYSFNPTTGSLDKVGITSITDLTTASNGLTKVGDDVRLGGALTANTTVSGAFNMIFDTTKFAFGSVLADTDFSLVGKGNTSATYGWQIQNSDNSQRAWFRNDGLFSATGGLSTDGVKSIVVDTVNSIIRIGKEAGLGGVGTTVISIGRDASKNSTANGIHIGDGAGNSSTGGNYFFGDGCGGNATGSENIGVGYNTLKQLTGGANIGIGNNAIGQASIDNSVGIGNGALQASSGNANYLIGLESGQNQTGSFVNGIGYRAARDNTRSDLFTVSYITDVFWNNVGDKGYTTLQAVTQQTAMSADGTNTSASASVFKIAQARGTGTGLGGDIIFQKVNLQASGTTRHTLSDWWHFTYDGKTGIGTPPFADTDLSVKGSGNTSATYGFQVQNSDNSGRLIWKNNAELNNVGIDSLGTTSNFKLINSSSTEIFDIRNNSEWYVNSDKIFSYASANDTYIRFGKNVLTNFNDPLLASSNGAVGFGISVFNVLPTNRGGVAFGSLIFQSLLTGGVAFGRGLGNSVTTGFGNTLMGEGIYDGVLTTGSDNIAIGRSITTTLSSLNNSLVFGSDIVHSVSNAIQFGQGWQYTSMRIGSDINYFPYSEFTQSLGDISTGTSNTSGLDWAWNGSRSTGTGVGGAHIFRISKPGSSGNTQNSLSDILRLEGTSNIGINGNSYGSGAGVMFMSNATTPPSSDPTGGYLNYARSGTFENRTSSGSIKTLHGDYTQVSATYTALITDEVIEATANTFTVNLYTAVGNKGRVLIINNQGAGVITVDADGTETINGSLTQTLNQYDSLTIVSNGTNWIII